MSLNLLDELKNIFNSDLIRHVAEYNGEEPAKIADSLKIAMPVSIAGIIQKVSTGGAASVLNLAKEAFNSQSVENTTSHFVAGGQGIPSNGPAMISSIFGDHFGGIANSLSGITGIKGSTASSLFGTLVPLSLGLIGKNAVENHLTPSSMESMLLTQKNGVMAAIPPGFSFSHHMPFAKLEPAVTKTVSDTTSRSWLWLVFSALILLGILAYLMKGCRSGDATAEIIQDSVAPSKTDTAMINPTFLKLKLPNGKEIDANKGSMEDQLVMFIHDSSAKPGKNVWFDFNELNFKFGTAEILPESQRQLANIVEILRAFPGVRVKIGGYTDKVGAEPANKKLSRNRANAVDSVLLSSGLSNQVTGAEGYGSDFAKFPADAPESDRVKDRHVSLSVRNK